MSANPLNVRQQYNPADRISIQVGQPVTNAVGLVNLLPNPDGTFGSWSWLQGGNARVTGRPTGDAGLRITQTGTAAQGRMIGPSPMIAVTPSTEAVAGQFKIVSTSTNAYVKASLYWYDSTQTFMVASADSSPVKAAGTVVYPPAYVVPAGAAYVRLAVTICNSAGTGILAVNEYAVVTNLMLAKSDAVGDFQSARTNQCLQPLVTSSTRADWWSLDSFTNSMTWDNTNKRLHVVKNHGNSQSFVNIHDYANIGTLSWSLSAEFAVDSADAAYSPHAGWTIYYQNSANQWVTTPWATVPIVAGTYTRVTQSITLPAGAHNVNLRPGVGFSTYNVGHDNWYIRNVIFETKKAHDDSVANGDPVFFTGDTPDANGWDYIWGNPTNAGSESYSYATKNAWTYSPPFVNQEISADANVINIDRAPLDASTAVVSLINPDLDPAQSATGTLAKGRRFQVLAGYDAATWGETSTTGDGLVWKPLFTGVIDNVKTAYALDKDNPGQDRVTVTVTAKDATKDLSNRVDAVGYTATVGMVEALGYRTQYYGVPYKFNAFTYAPQDSQMSVISSNANATILDQVALTRDTMGAAAYVSSAGVVTVSSIASLTTSPFSFTDAVPDSNQYKRSYSDIAIGYDTGNIVNSVVLHINSLDASGQAIETIYGPFVNEKSIDTYGAVSRDVTVHGVNLNATDAASWANGLLNTNAIPARRASNLTMPVNSDLDIKAATDIDLCFTVPITYSTLMVSAQHRVSHIVHKIDSYGWTVEYEFEDAATATPTAPVSPPATAAGVATYRVVASPGDVSATVGASGAITIPHGQAGTPVWWNIFVRTSGAYQVYSTGADGTNITGTIRNLGASTPSAGTAPVVPFVASGTAFTTLRWVGVWKVT